MDRCNYQFINFLIFAGHLYWKVVQGSIPGSATEAFLFVSLYVYTLVFTFSPKTWIRLIVDVKFHSTT